MVPNDQAKMRTARIELALWRFGFFYEKLNMHRGLGIGISFSACMETGSYHVNGRQTHTIAGMTVSTIY